jgi:hypothetical protein
VASDGETISLTEAIVALGLCFHASDLPEPFAEPLTIPKLVGMAVYTAMGWANRGAALAMAVDAANGVMPHGERSIVLTSDWLAPDMKWCEPTDPLLNTVVHMPTLQIPADQMAADIAGRLAEYRASVQRPN